MPSTIKLSGKLEDGTGIIASADGLYSQVGKKVAVLGLLSIDNHVDDAFGKRQVLLSVDTLEVADDDQHVRELLARIIEARGGNPTLPFAPSKLDALLEDIDTWAKTSKLSKPKVQQAWVDYWRGTNGDDSPVPVGPKGSAYLQLREFALSVGAIDDNPAKDTKTDDSTNDDPE